MRLWKCQYKPRYLINGARSIFFNGVRSKLIHSHWLFFQIPFTFQQTCYTATIPFSKENWKCWWGHEQRQNCQALVFPDGSTVLPLFPTNARQIKAAYCWCKPSNNPSEAMKFWSENKDWGFHFRGKTQANFLQKWLRL